jgi:hypothetical protein
MQANNKNKKNKSNITKGTNNFQVERIVSKRTEDGKLLYQVKWKGRSVMDNTWEPVESLNMEDIQAYEKYIVDESIISDSDKENNESKTSIKLLNKKRERDDIINLAETKQNKKEKTVEIIDITNIPGTKPPSNNIYIGNR